MPVLTPWVPMRVKEFAAFSFGFVLLFGASSVAQGILGYVNTTFEPGDNLAGNPLSWVGTHPLSEVMDRPPDGATISFWNPATRSFDRSSVYTNGTGWSQDFTWDPGQGVRLHAPSEFVEPDQSRSAV
jgi:hypothetical protein